MAEPGGTWQVLWDTRCPVSQVFRRGMPAWGERPRAGTPRTRVEDSQLQQHQGGGSQQTTPPRRSLAAGSEPTESDAGTSSLSHLTATGRRAAMTRPHPQDPRHRERQPQGPRDSCHPSSSGPDPAGPHGAREGGAGACGLRGRHWQWAGPSAEGVPSPQAGHLGPGLFIY